MTFRQTQSRHGRDEHRRKSHKTPHGSLGTAFNKPGRRAQASAPCSRTRDDTAGERLQRSFAELYALSLDQG
ncbi:MAG: hypothetical protein P1P89_16240 [Desulfobacterales bacterium]|nr:hypothetical protein [Desulfobacterales bacterium]